MGVLITLPSIPNSVSLLLLHNLWCQSMRFVIQIVPVDTKTSSLPLHPMRYHLMGAIIIPILIPNSPRCHFTPILYWYMWIFTTRQPIVWFALHPLKVNWNSNQMNVVIIPPSISNIASFHYTHQKPNSCNCTRSITNRAPSQYKDRLIYVWRFPC